MSNGGDLTEQFPSTWPGPHRYELHVLWGKWFPFNSFFNLLGTYNVLHVEDISKGVYQVEKWIADIEKTETDFLLLQS